MKSQLSAKRTCMIETLEDRMLFAVEQYNLLALLHYNKPGSNWTYGGTYSQVNDGVTVAKGTTNIVTSVASKTSSINGVASDVVSLLAGKLKLTTAWYTNSTGTFIDVVAEPSSQGVISVTLKNTKVGPANMVVGTKYSNKGTFSGSFGGTYAGKPYTATISGNDTLSAQLVGHKTVTVPKGKFNAIQGTDTATLSGKLSIKIAGKTVAGTFTATHAQTFYAVPSQGIVKFAQTENLAMNVPEIYATNTKFTSTGNLISDILK